MPVINFSAVNAKGSKAPLDAGTWEVVLAEVNTGESSQKKTPYVELVWKVTDEDAVKTDGASAKNSRVWDTYYMSEKALWRVQKVASALGVELDFPETGEVDVSEVQSVVAEAFRDAVGDSANVVTELRDYTNKNGEDAQATDVKEVTA